MSGTSKPAIQPNFSLIDIDLKEHLLKAKNALCLDAIGLDSNEDGHFTYNATVCGKTEYCMKALEDVEAWSKSDEIKKLATDMVARKKSEVEKLERLVSL